MYDYLCMYTAFVFMCRLEATHVTKFCRINFVCLFVCLIYTQQNNLRVSKYVSLYLTMNVILFKLKIVLAFKGPLKSFLDKTSNYSISISTASKKLMAPTRSDQKICRYFENS